MNAETAHKQIEQPWAINERYTDIPERFRDYISHCARTSKEIKGTPDGNRIAVVVSAFNAKELLTPTFKDLIQQAREASKTIDIFVCLNNGGGNTAKWLAEIEQNSTLFVADKKINTHILKTTETDAPPSQAKPIYVENHTDLINSDINIVIIDQNEQESNKGKNRALRDTYELLFQLNQTVGYNPKYLLTIDAETHLLSKSGNPLNNLIQILEKNKLDFVGAKGRGAPYDKNGIPQLDLVVPPLQYALSLIHGIEGVSMLPGGGTLGKFDVIAPIMKTLPGHYSGQFPDDVMLQLSALALNFTYKVTEDVEHTNRCLPYTKENLAGIEKQMQRWMGDATGLEVNCGKKLTTEVFSNNFPKILKQTLLKIYHTQESWVRVPELVLSIFKCIKMLDNAKQHPHDFQNGDPSW